MLNIVCVNQGNYCGRGKEYVEILYNMVRRNTEKEFNFICYTDDTEDYHEKIEKRPLPEGLKGWWCKLWLFKDLNGAFYFDLDTVITSDIEEILEYSGKFAILRDFYRPDGYGSGMMAWNGDYSYIWDRFDAEGRPEIDGGDQAFIEQCVPDADLWQEMYKGIYSYKAHCEKWPPDDCKVVCFHGFPRPHDINESWVNFIWKIDGAQNFSESQNKDFMNTSQEEVANNMRQNVLLDVPWFIPMPALSETKTLCIVGGSPSLKDNIKELRKKIRLGAKVMSLNGTLGYLLSIGIKPDFHAQFDARPSCADFLEKTPDIKYFIGSMSDPCVFEKVKGKDVEMWHGGFDIDLQKQILEPFAYKPIVIIGGGSTIGLRALNIGYLKGYYKFDIFGMDSCFVEKKHHAYEQKQNDMDGYMNVHVNNKTYQCAPWMYRQALNFQKTYKELTNLGCKIKVYGQGLIPDLCEYLNNQ